MKILGIETSCDETAVAIVDDARTIHANLVLSQLEEHRAFGGVVPEIAARAHADHLHSLIRAALEDSGLALEDMDGFAATCGPGLIGGVMIGMVAAKALSVHRFKGGLIIAAPRSSHRSTSAARIRVLAATPPAMTTRGFASCGYASANRRSAFSQRAVIISAIATSKA